MLRLIISIVDCMRVCMGGCNAAASAALAAKKKAAAAEPAANPASSAAGPARLKAMDIKKMNGDALKEHLKERKLDVQGQKKDLMKRLIDYEEARS